MDISTKPIIVKTIQDVVRENYNKSLVITLFIANANLNLSRTTKLDKSVPSIAFGTSLIDKYVYSITSGNVPDIMRRKVKSYCVFLEDFPSISKSGESDKIINLINASNIVIISLDVEHMSDYMLYFKFIEFLQSKKSKIISRPIGNLFIAKQSTAPNIDLNISSINEIIQFPQSTILTWSGDSIAQLKTNIGGFEEIRDENNNMTFGKKIALCVSNSLYEIFLNSGISSAELKSYVELINGILGER